ncbi:hypothetical protein GCM10009760_39610 [Kitasatospora kazusensis]|uniref:Uncharacterized protein n=1 Tax=Kitasatospora kazusensis TaxID=407974 RepID=A0ABP5LIU3_9ACTN
MRTCPAASRTQSAASGAGAGRQVVHALGGSSVRRPDDGAGALGAALLLGTAPEGCPGTGAAAGAEPGCAPGGAEGAPERDDGTATGRPSGRAEAVAPTGAPGSAGAADPGPATAHPSPATASTATPPTTARRTRLPLDRSTMSPPDSTNRGAS